MHAEMLQRRSANFVRRARPRLRSSVRLLAEELKLAENVSSENDLAKASLAKNVWQGVVRSAVGDVARKMLFRQTR